MIIFQKKSTYTQGIEGLDCWIAQSGLQSNLVDWIVIDNPKSKLSRLSIHFENWIWIWIVNHIFVMDLDWIDSPKKLD